MELYPKLKSTIINGKILIIVYGIARNAKVCIFNNIKITKEFIHYQLYANILKYYY